MTGEQIFVLSMALIDEMNSNGTIDGNKTKDYRGKAASILTLIQNEILDLENPTHAAVVITSLSNDVVMSNKAASMIAPYGLAAHFMLAEMNNDLFNYFNGRYETLKLKVRKIADIEEIETVDDEYASNGPYEVVW